MEIECKQPVSHFNSSRVEATAVEATAVQPPPHALGDEALPGARVADPPGSRAQEGVADAADQGSGGFARRIRRPVRDVAEQAAFEKARTLKP